MSYCLVAVLWGLALGTNLMMANWSAAIACFGAAMLALDLAVRETEGAPSDS